MTRHASERRKSTINPVNAYSESRSPTSPAAQVSQITKTENFPTQNAQQPTELSPIPRPATRDESVVPRAMWVNVKDDDPEIDVVFNARLIHYGVN